MLFVPVALWLGLWFHLALRIRLRALSKLGIERPEATHRAVLILEGVCVACALVFPLLLAMLRLPPTVDPLWLVPSAIYATSSNLLVYWRIPEAAPNPTQLGIADVRAFPFVRWSSVIMSALGLGLSIALGVFFLVGMR